MNIVAHHTVADSPALRLSDAARVIVVPGLRGSGEAHWQSEWGRRHPHWERVQQADWARAELRRWTAQVVAQLDAAEESAWLVAHSFGCLASVAAAVQRPERVRGLFLVAPADPQRFGCAAQLPRGALPGRALVIGSENDPWMRALDVVRWARNWGGAYRSIGAAGHINVDSGHGPWPEGLALFSEFARMAAPPCRYGGAAGVSARALP